MTLHDTVYLGGFPIPIFILSIYSTILFLVLILFFNATYPESRILTP